jgi:hypothetical protein
MRRRKFLIGAGSIAAGSAAAMGSGAFEVLARDRDATGTIVNDNVAYLNLNSGNYSEIGPDGQLDVSLDGNGNGGAGLNGDSVTQLDDVFYIENTGPNSLNVEITTSNFQSDVNIQEIPITSDGVGSGDLNTNLNGTNPATLQSGEQWGIGVVVGTTANSNGGSVQSGGTFTVDANEV